LARAGLPTAPGPLFMAVPLGLGCPHARARVRAGEAGRAILEFGAKPDCYENPVDSMGKILYIIMFNSIPGYRMVMI
jgi:hypothetical protein